MFYKLTRWKKKRERILRRDEYLCQECKRYGKTTLATTVHHIFQLEKYPNLALVSLNLVSLCSKCHDKMHDRNTNQLTDAGRRLQDRVSPPLRAKGFKVPGTGEGNFFQ